MDTNIAAFVIKGAHPHVLARLAEHPRSTVAMSVVTEMELRFGVQKEGAPPSLVERVADFLRAVSVLELPRTIASEDARVRVDLERAGRPIGVLGTIIAAQAATPGAILVTNNVREYGRVKGLRFEDWSRP